ncbi:hypothetical protein CFP56_005184 [Quercus suber]|uniref:Uncharacterized protein n=1 Tax=Quercus suber TaxID=58331 RepID=A0AAW0LBN1_QUESU
MVVLSLQVVQFRPSPPQHFPLHSNRPSKGNIIRCGIAEWGGGIDKSGMYGHNLSYGNEANSTNHILISLPGSPETT